MTKISIEDHDTKIHVISPYHPEFINAAHELNGKWRNPAWVFDARDLGRVTALCREIYGTAGEPTDLATVRVDLDYFSPPASFFLLGRMVVSRKSRDSAVKLGEGVVIIQGGFPNYGGSAKYPSLNEQAETILEVRDVPLRLVEDYRLKSEANAKAVDIVSITRLEVAESDAEDPRAVTIANIRALMAEYGITLADLADVEVALIHK